jgi:hypothetical protein
LHIRLGGLKEEEAEEEAHLKKAVEYFNQCKEIDADAVPEDLVESISALV